MAATLPPGEYRYPLAHIQQSISTSMIAVNVVLPAVATVFVVLRMLACKMTRASWQANDFVLMAALLVVYILCIEAILCARFGMGHHLLYILKLHPNDLTDVLKLQFSIEMTWNICTYLVKLSNILLLARIFGGPASPRFRLSLHLVHAFLFLWIIAAFFSVLFRCAPVQSLWDMSVEGRCSHAQAGRIAAAALNSFTDVILLSLAIRPAWLLHLPVKQNLAVVGMFGVGIFCLAASAVRLDYSVAVSRYHKYDYTYIDAAPVLWASVEPCASIVCACLPLLRPLFINVQMGNFSGWVSGSLFSRGSRKEADTWWHPPSEELETDNDVGGIGYCGERANPDRSFMPSGQHKVEVNEEVVTVTEIREGKPSMDNAIQGFDKCSWTLEKGIGVAV